MAFPGSSGRPQDLLSGVGVLGGVGGAYAGDGHSGGGGQVGEPVGAGAGQLPRVGQEDADIAVGLVPAVAGIVKGGQDRIGGGRGIGDACVVEVGRWSVHGCCLSVQSLHSPRERGM